MMQLVLAAAVLALASTQAVQRTRVTTYVPVIPAGRAVAGACWTRSIAAPTRPDAYRCMTGNSIYDPCFVPKRSNVAVCDVDPVTNGRGFALRLTEPLPNEPVFTGRAQPWLVEVADGEVCIPLTGTHEAIDGQTILYECSESRALRNAGSLSGLIDGSFTAGTVWRARRAVYQEASHMGKPTGTVTTVPLAAVWL